MIRNYIKIAWRNIYKNKLFSAINVISLAIGLSASFVIGLMCYYDFTFDDFHSEGEHVFRVTSNFYSNEGIGYNAGTPLPMANYLKESVSGLEAVVPMYSFGIETVKNNYSDEVFKEIDHVILTNDDYFNVFQYHFLAGSQSEALANPNQIVLSEERASIYFPNKSLDDIIGNVLLFNDSISLKVTGVVESFKKRTDLIFQEFVSVKTISQTDLGKRYKKAEWNSTSNGHQVFIKLNNKNVLESVTSQLKELAEAKADKESLARGDKRLFYLQPLSDLHFNANYGVFNFTASQASKSVLYGLIVIALFLLLLGCINFINLNTAQATQRAKEIGIRKTLGSSKRQLILQFLGETFLLTIISAIVSIILSFWLLQAFSDFIPKGVSFSLFKSPILLFGIALVLLLVTFLSGFYPALILSRYKPVLVLKGHLFDPKHKSSFRKILIVFQFSIAQIFIISTFLVGKQIHFLMDKDMGFKTEAIATFRTPWKDKTIAKKVVLANKLKENPQIQSVSLGGATPASRSTHSTGVFYFDGTNKKFTALELLYGDTNYLDLYEISLLAGRDRLNDTIKEFVINEAYFKTMGLATPQEAIGKTIAYDKLQIPIVGVMKNFHQRSLRTAIKPMAMIGDWDRNWRTSFNRVHIALQKQATGNWSEIIAKIEKEYKNVYPDTEFKFQFMDETIQRFYKREQNLSKLLNWVMGLSVLISCLGLLGLVIYTTERRVKEIGVRKVLGATIAQLNLLLCKEFIFLVLIAFFIAVPIAWYGIHNWLQDFAYKTSLSWWIFAISGLLMLLVALIIMSLRTIQTAMKNPVNSLRTE